MLYRLVRPMQRKGSTKQQFVQRIPADVKAKARGMKLSVPVGPDTITHRVSPKADAIRLSLRTSVPSEVKRRQAQVAAYLENVWQALRADQPIALTHREATALAGELYRAWADERKQTVIGVEQGPDGSWIRLEEPSLDDPGEWEAVLRNLDRIGEDADPEDLELHFGPIIDRLLLAKGIAAVTPGSRRMLLPAFQKALRDAAELRKRNAEGDYSPDPNAKRFPAWPAREEPRTAAEDKLAVSLSGLVESWWKEAQSAGRAASTYDSYRNTFSKLVEYIGHDDATSISPTDVVGFKDHRLAQGVSAKTVGDSDIAGLRSVFSWAVANMLLPTNPAEKVRVTRSKVVHTRQKGFSSEEARAILRHSLNHKRGRESPKTFAAKRWIPWLCAYTGARVGEMAQLRKQDVRREGDMWIITITPEAGTVKDKEAREVVLHEHLVELGFPDFVNDAPDGYLFINPDNRDDFRGVWRSIKNRLREFAREVVKDRAVAPNHGWRHSFKTLGREAGIADSILDAICGHAPRTVGGSYGAVSLEAQRRALTQFPRFDVF